MAATWPADPQHGALAQAMRDKLDARGRVKTKVRKPFCRPKRIVQQPKPGQFRVKTQSTQHKPTLRVADDGRSVSRLPPPGLSKPVALQAGDVGSPISNPLAQECLTFSIRPDCPDLRLNRLGPWKVQSFNRQMHRTAPWQKLRYSIG
jgi:hypothetical protein